MAKSKTGSFWLTENIQLPANSVNGTRVQSTIDLGAYVDVGDQQAIAIEQVDWITQRDGDFGTDVNSFLTGNGSLSFQLSDLNPGSLMIRADDNTLIASGNLNIDDANNVATSAADFYPDSFGKVDESRMVVNDQLYAVVGNDGVAVGTANLFITCRIKARIVKLTTKDWMAIAIQSTASDN